MAALRPDWEFHVAAHSSTACMTYPDNVTVHVDEDAESRSWKTRLWYEQGLPRLAKRLNSDLLFSQTNYLPTRPLSCPTLLLEQHAGHFSKVFDQLMRAQLGKAGQLAWAMKTRWVRASVRRATVVTVQTQALAHSVVKTTGISNDKVAVIAHGPGLVTQTKKPAAYRCGAEPISIGYITKHGVQKNFQVLLLAARALKDRKLPFRLVLTLNPDVEANQIILSEAASLGLKSELENLGELDPVGVNAAYESLHAFVFPSLCESFGFPMVEALSYGIPLLISDTAGNRELCGSAGITFSPNDHEVLAQKILRLATENSYYASRAKDSFENRLRFSWDRSAMETIAIIERMLE
ncbi:glycosyltransferase [Verrucomicrobiales bacterium]|nr:glycosyltransferase [Verrucomicrobiales bacterium]